MDNFCGAPPVSATLEGMTLHPLPPPSRRPRPPRSGEPWTESDYATLVRLCREGRTARDIAAELGRSDASVADRASRMLPLDERGGPRDLSVHRLRHHLQQDDDYDWQAALMQTPPPRPVVEHVHPPPVRRGIPGLDDDELVTLAELLSQTSASASDESRRALSVDIGRQILHRGLEERVLERATDHAQERAQRLVEDCYGAAFGGWCPPPRRGPIELEPGDVGRELGWDDPTHF